MWSKTGKIITSEQFDIRLISEYPYISRVGEYINSNTPIIFKCLNCGKEFNKKPKDLNKLKCKCIDRGLKYKNDIIVKKIIILENYVNMRSKIKHQCLNCLDIFITSPKSVINSITGCPSCSGKIHSIDKYKSLLPKNIELLSTEYIGSQYKHNHKCLDCNSEFYTKPNYILHINTNCPICSSSKGERIISDFFKSIKLDYNREFVVNIFGKNLRFDFYISSLDLFIEYDGIQHNKEVEFFGGEKSFLKRIEYDEMKDNWCFENNKTLLRISHNDDILGILKDIFI